MRAFETIFSRQGVLSILTILGLIAINLIWLLPTIKNIHYAASNLALALAERASSDVASAIDNSLRDLDRAAEEIAFEPERKETVIRNLLKHNFAFRSAALAASDGREVMRIDQMKLVTAEDFRDHSKDAHFYLALEGAASVSKVQISPELEPFATVAVPVTRLGKINLVLVADLNLRDILATIRTPGLDKGHIYIVDREGLQILHPDLSELIHMRNYSSRAIVSKVLLQGSTADGLGADDSYTNERGGQVFAVGVPLPNLGWGLFVEQPKAQAFNGEQQAIVFAGLTIILGILVTLVISWSNIRLGQLNARLKELLGENFESAKMLIQRDRELGGLNDNLVRLNSELNEVTKILIRRDIELSEANTRLQELDRVKSEFVSVAAHQLRTPLTGIRWSYHALLEKENGKLNAEQEDLIHKGLTAAMAMIELINNLLNLARIEEGRFGFSFTRQSMGPILEKSFALYKDAAAEKGVKLTLEKPKSALPLFDADEEKMLLAINNLLDNAIKYTSPGGEIVLKVSTVAKNKLVHIEVRDTGIGVPKNQIDHLFSKFFRADNALSFHTLGSGLGLYVVKNIIERHGGSIAVESVENKGTTFSIDIPTDAKIKT